MVDRAGVIHKRQPGKPKLDWVPVHHPRSREEFRYGDSTPVAVEQVKPEQRNWRTGPVIDQGREGACVGFGWTNELTASPYPYYQEQIPGEVQSFAKRLYNRARAHDRAMGYRFAEGASVLAGARATQQLKLIGEYRWCMNMEELRVAVQKEGPVVIGIPWHEGMYETRPSGLVKVSGRVVGGHCLLIHGYHPGMRINGEGWFKRYEVYRWFNSWGPDYGNEGEGLILAEDLAALLKQQGEACIPMRRAAIKGLIHL